MVPTTRQKVWKASLIALVVAAIAGVIFVPVELPLSIDTSGHVSARREWIVTHGDDGRLVTMLHDNRERTVERVAVAVYDRGDRVEVTLRPDIRDGAPVHAGDTIAFIRSEEAVARATELRGVRAAEEAGLGIYESGEKEARVRAARAEVERARLQIEYERRQMERVRVLAERGIASASELDEHTNLLRAAEIGYDRAVADLAAIESGAKEQEIAWRRARLRAATDDAEIASRRLADSVIVAPFSGRVAALPGSAALITLRSTDTTVVHFPIPWTQRNELTPGQIVHVTVDGVPTAVQARIFGVGQTALVANGQQFVEVTATIDFPTSEIVPGLYVRCSVSTGHARPLQWIAHELHLL